MEAASDAEVAARLQEQGHLPVEAAPVSYTHLDVYKRQLQLRAGVAGAGAGGDYTA